MFSRTSIWFSWQLLFLFSSETYFGNKLKETAPQKLIFIFEKVKAIDRWCMRITFPVLIIVNIYYLFERVLTRRVTNYWRHTNTACVCVAY